MWMYLFINAALPRLFLGSFKDVGPMLIHLVEVFVSYLYCSNKIG
jgi:hypothetical protein